MVFHVGKYTVRPMDAMGCLVVGQKYNFCWAKDSSASVPLISFVPTKARLTQMLCEIPASHNHQQTNQGAGGLLNHPLEKSAPVKLDHLKGIEI